MVEPYNRDQRAHRSGPAKVEPGVLVRVWNWFVDPSRGYDDRPPMYHHNDPFYSHVCVYDFMFSRRNKWRIEAGKPIGKHYDLDQVIQAVKENPSFTETKLEILENWKASGKEIVFVSHNIYKCRICGKVKEAEFFTTPAKKDGSSPLVVDFNEYRRKAKTTQKMPTVATRREIPVERMPRYK